MKEFTNPPIFVETFFESFPENSKEPHKEKPYQETGVVLGCEKNRFAHRSTQKELYMIAGQYMSLQFTIQLTKCR